MIDSEMLSKNGVSRNSLPFLKKKNNLKQYHNLSYFESLKWSNLKRQILWLTHKINTLKDNLAC